MKTLQEVVNAVKGIQPKRVAVSAAADADVLEAIQWAYESGIAQPILVAGKAELQQIAAKSGIDLTPFEIIDVPDPDQSALEAVKLVSSGKADIIMKGLLQSGSFLKAVLHPEFGLRKENRVISSIAMMEASELGRLLMITDPGFIPCPDLNMKKSILRNAVEVAHKLGLINPNVAVLCASEVSSPKLQATMDAKALEEMNQSGEITGCTVAGPISLDLAISQKSAAHKGYTHPVAGCADILLVPTVEVGNVLYKSLVYFTNMPTGGVMTGAKAPIIFTSRADSPDTKFNTIALAAYLAMKG